MRNVHTYRLCALVAAAMIPVGAARDEISTVVVAGVGALFCLRWARQEADRELLERERRIADAYRDIGDALGGTLSHVRLVREEPSNRLSINGLEISTPTYRVERAPVTPPHPAERRHPTS